MKRILLYLWVGLISMLPIAAAAQGGTWTWVKGSNTSNAVANRGTQGVPAVSNVPGGLTDMVNWVDLQGNFWIFGGTDLNGEESDLWQFNPTTNIWTWMKGPGTAGAAGNYGTIGVPAASNNPGARGESTEQATSWTDAVGNLWLWGGYGLDGNGNFGYLNDLWMYNVSTNMWTWMNGSSSVGAADVYGTIQVFAAGNTPGGRFMANAAWADDNGDLWLFGGESQNGCYNDMWKYSVSLNQWAWMSGPQGVDQPGSYGTMGVASSTNLPPPRGCSTHWKDVSGNFYMWAGYYVQPDMDYADVWMYNPNTNIWTWTSGSSQMNYPGSYGTYCTDNGYTGPTGRWDNPACQMLGCSNVGITFGGEVEQLEVDYNDLWLYNNATGQWRWMSGSNTSNDPGNYGIIGVPALTNSIPSRQGQVMWIDNTGNLWVFGGIDGASFGGLNDMWEFAPSSTCLPAPLSGGINYTLANNTICVGDSALLSLSGIDSAQITPANALSWVDSFHAYLHPGATTTFVITGHSTCRAEDTARVTLYVVSPGQFNYLLGDSQICEGNSVWLTMLGLINPAISPSGSVTWQDSLHVILTPDSTTTYFVTSQSSVCGVPDTGTITVDVTQFAPVDFSLNDSILCYGSSALLSYTNLYNVTISPSYYSYQLDSNHIGITAYSTMGFTLSGTTSCGSNYTNSFNLYVSGNGQAGYSLDKRDICLGDTARLALTGGLSGAQIFPTTGVVWIDTAHAYLIPDTSTAYTITGISSACGGAASASFEIHVIQPGFINYQITDTNICIGFDAYLQIFGAQNITITPASFVYTTDSVDAYSYLTPDTTTTYMITGQSVCGTTDTSYVTIHATPFADYTLSPGAVCYGDSSYLSIIGLANASLSPTTNVNWVDSAHAWLSPDTTTTYYLTGLDCDGFNENYIITVSVVRPGQLDFTLSDSDICSGGEVYLTVSGAYNPVLTPFNYLYMQDSTDYYGYLYPTTSTTYTITGTSVCGGPATATFDVNIVGSGYFLLSTPLICAGDSATIQLIGFSNVEITNAAGQPDSTALLVGYNGYLFPDTTTTYYIRGNTVCEGVYYQPFTVVVHKPIVDVIATDTTTICNTDSSQLCATPGFNNYAWNNGLHTSCIWVYLAGNYYVTATDPTGCTAESNHLAVTVIPNPPVSLSVNGDTLTAYGALSYQWYYNGIAIQGATDSTYIATIAGNYSVGVTNTDGCPSISNPINISSISDISFLSQIKVYPNPTAESWFMDVSDTWIGSTYTIYDAEGREIFGSEIRGPKTEINLPIASGVYLMKIHSQQGSAAMRLIKLSGQ